MGYEQIEPAHRKKLERKRYKGHNTICQKLREIYQKTDDEEIKSLCCIAYAMGKKMHNKLKEYKEKEIANGLSINS